MKNISEEFNELLYNLSQKEIIEKDMIQAKKCFADYISVLTGGATITRDKFDELIKNSEGKYSVIGYERKVSMNAAILVNAYNAHVLEMDDGHRVAMMHLAAPIFSALISVGETINASLEDILKSSMIGYEAAIRLAGAIQPGHKKKGFHATGTCGTVGSAVAVAVLLRYSKEEMLNVLCAAATSAAGLLEAITGKSEQKPYNIANAAATGVNAALVGKKICGPSDILGGERGFVRNFADSFDAEYLMKANVDMAMNRIYMKPYAACRHCHAPIEATLNIGIENKIDFEQIEKIIVETYGLAIYGHDHKRIEGENSAKMSIPYSVAVSLLYKKAGMEMFNENIIFDTNIEKIMNKITVKESDELSKLVPEKRSAIVTVYLKNGEKLTKRVDYPKGEPENPISYEELFEKFSSLMAYSNATKQKIDEVWNAIWNMKSIKICDLLEMVNY
jgi:2-methylcitrate dehydratase PrpD